MSAPGRPSPMKAANEVSVLLRAVLGEETFPVDVAMVAKEYSKKFADPITKVVGEAIDGFEGMLRPSQKKRAWHIIYNNGTEYDGRERFTLAHEFGHYLLHRRPLGSDAAQGLGARQAAGHTFTCNPLERDKWKAKGESIEEEADTFASYLLMPMDDYRQQVGRQDIDLDLLTHITDRYRVSLTAAVRKWIEMTDRRAAMVLARDGFALWGRASDAAYKTGVFIKSGTAIPDMSIAARGPDAQQGETNRPIGLPAGIWTFPRGSEPVRELAIFANRLGQTLSILMFEDEPPHDDDDEPRVWDTYDQFQWRG